MNKFGIYFDIDCGWILQFTNPISDDINNSLSHDIGILSLDQTGKRFYSTKHELNVMLIIKDTIEVFRSISEICEYSPIEQSNIIHNIQKINDSFNLSQTVFNMKTAPKTVQELWTWSQIYCTGSFSFNYIEEFKGYYFSFKNVFGVTYPLPILEYISSSIIQNSYLIDNGGVFLEDESKLVTICNDILYIGFKWADKIPLSDKLDMHQIDNVSNYKPSINKIATYKESNILEKVDKSLWLKLDENEVAINETSIDIILEKLHISGMTSLTKAELLALEYWSNM